MEIGKDIDEIILIRQVWVLSHFLRDSVTKDLLATHNLLDLIV